MDREELVRRYKARPSAELRERIVKAFFPIVRSKARRCGRGEYDDLVSAGLVGLLMALDNYDPAEGVMFATYAGSRIYGCMLHEVRDRSELIRRPAWVWEARIPSVPVSSITDLEERRLEGGEAWELPAASPGDYGEPDTTDRILLRQLVDALPDKQRSAVVGVYLLGHTQSEVAKQLGLSVNYIGDLLRSGIGKIQAKLFGSLGA